jgi:hypothetical protein
VLLPAAAAAAALVLVVLLLGFMLRLLLWLAAASSSCRHGPAQKKRISQYRPHGDRHQHVKERIYAPVEALFHTSMHAVFR